VRALSCVPDYIIIFQPYLRNASVCYVKFIRNLMLLRKTQLCRTIGCVDRFCSELAVRSLR